MSSTSFNPRIIAAIAAVLCMQIFCVPCAFSSPQSEYDEGLRLYSAKKYTEAAKAFWKSIEQGNSSPKAWLYVAHAMSAAGNKAEAIRFYRKVVTIYKGQDAEKMARQALVKLDPAGKWDVVPSSTPTVSAAVATVSDLASLPERARIFYRDERGSIMVPVRINGRPLDMAFDTGAPHVVLDKEHLKSIGLIPPSGNAAGVSGGASNSIKIPYWDMSASVQVGPVKRDNIPLKVYDKMETHPLLGQGFFKDFDYTIDRQAQCLELRRKGLVSHGQSGGNYSIPFEFREHGNRIIVQVEVNGKKAPMMFDTGNAAAGVCFKSMEQMKRWGVSLPEDARLGSSTGVSGRGQCYRFELNRVRMGPIEKSNLSALVDLEVHDREDLPLLGADMWEGWQYTIDMNSKQIHFLRR